ncbi:MAG TPA: sugar ABC transporter permease [Propioniciclava sp.]|jgi:multiple sugar transport system permease protein|uniref:carbohydrate ABC transporter permease n=1 Tax=Propioniciclava sp. TaxID=2038686 RepID=UPI002C16E459|nr:sugar ABC transporter permease [Propioniciclava sp.]HRL50137.1 sugar ABC transporter permease [Propioniciclava sp.]HRL79033.1 sugar ABC transporter permease [Propioniciclava sp.]
MTATTTTQPAARDNRPRRRREARAGYAFLSPWLLGFFVLTVGPMIASLYLSFTDYNLFSAPRIVGVDNYVRLFSDPNFLQAVKVTGTYVLVGTPLKLLAALAVAMLLNMPRRGQGFYRSAFYLPSLIGGSVSIAIVWKAMFLDGGIVAQVGSVLGGPPASEGGWVGDPSRTLPLLILLTVWQFGAPMVIFLAGLKQVPVELYEAAAVDGAGPIRRFFAVTLPMLSPVLFFNLLLETIHAFQIFNSAYIISNGTGGPAGSTLFYTLYLYLRGFRDFQMGYASAMAWVLVVAVGLVTIMMFRTSTAWVHYAGDER